MKNWNLLRAGCAFIALMVPSVGAMAQEADTTDVLVMRRSIAVPQAPTQVVPPPAGSQTEWSYTEWSNWSSQCSDNATRTRQASCTEIPASGPQPANITNCDVADREALSESASIYSGCTPAWTYGEWGWQGVAGAKSSTCSSSPQQTRTASCLIQTADGLEARPEAQCGNKSINRSLLEDYTGCTYTWAPNEWGDWSSSCSQTATRTRTTLCIRDQDGRSVSPSNCEAGHPDSQTSETGENMTSCGGVIKNGGFESGLTDWSTVAVYSRIVNDAYSGANAVHLIDGASRLYQTVVVDVPVGATITFSFQCKQVGDFSFRAQLRGGGVSESPAFTCNKNSYELKSYVYTATEAGSDIYVRLLGTGSGNRYSMIIDDVRLTVE